MIASKYKFVHLSVSFGNNFLNETTSAFLFYDPFISDVYSMGISLLKMMGLGKDRREIADDLKNGNFKEKL